jgi:hypothetical protein
MSAVGYACKTEGAVALAAATAKCVVGAKAHANSGLQLKGILVAFDGVTAGAVPVLVEICYCTWGANAPGTNSTSTTPVQTYGRALTAGFTSGKTWTTEPTTITVLKELLLSPIGGAIAFQYPLGQEPDCALGEGFAIRCTAPAIVNVRGTLDVERI